MNTERAQVGWGFGLRWMLASIVGLAVGFVVGAVVAGAVGGAFPVYGAITGGVLVWLLRQPVKEEPSPPQDAE